ncbi:hypothetical protein ACFC0C_28205 [Streptomyces sp. NPDC056178]|uniref:hypothetical protein n=1 Tax=unclassified Streptomyces TaxID=2593676 RepID=UPI0035DD0FB9
MRGGLRKRAVSTPAALPRLPAAALAAFRVWWAGAAGSKVASTAVRLALRGSRIIFAAQRTQTGCPSRRNRTALDNPHEATAEELLRETQGDTPMHRRSFIALAWPVPVEGARGQWATTPDGRRKGPDDWTRRPVTIGTGATIGAGAAVAPGVTVGAHALVAVGAVVLRDVPAHGLVVGNPARQVGWVCRCGQTLDPVLHCTTCQRVYRRDGDELTEHQALSLE